MSILTWCPGLPIAYAPQVSIPSPFSEARELTPTSPVTNGFVRSKRLWNAVEGACRLSSVSARSEPISLVAYLIALTGIALAQASPGPALFAVAGAGLGHGRRAAFFVVFGIASGILVWVVAAAAGLGALLALYPAILTAMKVFGGAYLCFIAFKSLRSAAVERTPSITADQGGWTPLTAWRRGLFVNLTNPKSALSWAAVATFLYGSGLTAPQVLGFAPIGCVSAIVIYGVYAVMFSTGVVRKVQRRFARATDALFGLAFGAIGARILFDGVGEVVRR